MEVENKLKAMGLELPAAGAPPPGRAGAVKIGNILFVGGHTPGPAYRGKLGAGFTVEQGYDGARQACLNCLADVKAVIGDLDKVKRVAKLLCMVNSAPDFGQQPLVANGATDLLRQLYGDAGAHARSAVGLAALPNGACIEIEMILGSRTSLGTLSSPRNREDRRRWYHCLLRRDDRSDLEDGWHQTEPSPQRWPRDVQVVKEHAPALPLKVYIPR